MGCATVFRFFYFGPGAHRLSLAAVTFLLALAVDVAAQPISFARTDVPSVSGARAIATEDFNRDGWPDIAHANTGRNSVTVLLNRAGAGFAPAIDLPVGVGPFDLTTADFNRDGIPDLAVANADGNSITVLLGKGDGTFSRADIAAAGQNPRGITAGDVNKDGKPDLIYSGYASDVVQVLVGDGTGRFTKGAAVVSAFRSPQGLATGDFNHDGHLDIAVADASAVGLRILFGNGGTAFTVRTIGRESNLNVLVTGDFNHDGWLDVAAASTVWSTVAVYQGTAGGLVLTQPAAVGPSPRGLAVADVNDDGLPDVVTANRSSSTVSVLLGDQAHPGSFLPAQDVAAGAGSRDVVAGDFDGDGIVDLATGNEYASGATLLSNTTTFARAAYAFRPTTRGSGTFWGALTHSLWPADFDGDGRVDLATASSDLSGVTVVLATGAAIALPVPLGVRAVAAADFNRDGNADVLYASAPSPATIGVYAGNGHGQFTAGAVTGIPWASEFFFPSFAVGDLDRDGSPDLAFVAYDARKRTYVLQLMCGRADGTFEVTSQIDVHSDATPALADVDRDGKLDVSALPLFTPGGPGTLRIWSGDGTGRVAAAPLEVPSVRGAYVLADVNRDGYLDVVVGGGGDLQVLPGSVTGFGPAIRTPMLPFDYSYAIAVTDLNIDGKPDVVVGAGRLMFGNGDGTFVSGGLFDFAGNSLLVADLTNDGLPDIASSQLAGEVRVLANDRTDVNRFPVVEAADRTISYRDTQLGGEDCHPRITALAFDPDAHSLTYEWRDEAGKVISTYDYFDVCKSEPGTYVYSVAVRDGRGGEASDSFTLTILPVKEIVLWAADAETEGVWTHVADPTAAGSVRAYDPNAGRPKVAAPVALPTSRLIFTFYADPTQTYKLWIRLKADGDGWGNDSVWVQFSGATDLSGTPRYQWATSSGLAVNLEECSGCGESGWGWEDDGWGAPDRNGGLLRFPQNPDHDAQVLIIQTREDGVSIDQIVLSAEKYLTRRPGTAKNDTTILPATPRR